MKSFNKSFITTLILFAICISAKAQWATKMSGSAGDFTTSIDHDSKGNVYATGYFTDSAMFGSTKLYSSGSTDIFIAMYNGSGTLQWAKAYGGKNYDRPNDINVDATGNIYITGRYEDSTTFGKTTLKSIKGGKSKFDMFVAKLDNSGNVTWAKSGGSKNYDFGRRVKVDANGNVYVGGGFGDDQAGGTVVDTGFYGSISLYGLGGGDACIVKYDINGKELWGNLCGGTSVDQAYDLDLDGSDYPYIMGTWYTGTTSGGKGTFGGYSTTGRGGYDVFAAKVDTSSGKFLWAESGGGDANDYGYGLAADKSGNCYITGYYGYNPSYVRKLDSAQFGSLPYLVKKGGYQMFLVKFDTKGTAQWSTQGGSESDDYGYDVDIDTGGNAIVSGQLAWGSATYKGRISYFDKVRLLNVGLFTASYDPSGKLNNVDVVDSKDSSSIILTVRANNSTPAVSGYFTASSIIINGNTLTNGGSLDGFAAVLDDNGKASSAQSALQVTTKGSQTLCSGDTFTIIAPSGYGKYQWFNDSTFIGETIANSKFFLTTGNYRVTAISNTGFAYTSASYIVTVNPKPNSTMTFKGSLTICNGDSVRLTVNNGGYNIQWQRNGVDIPGETAAIYYATLGGTYRVKATNGSTGCFSYSNSINVTGGYIATPTIKATSNTTICSGDSVRLEGSSATGCTISWTQSGSTITGATDTIFYAKDTGDYQMIYSNGTCSPKSSNSIKISVNKTPGKAVTTSGNTTFCPGDSVTLYASTGIGFNYVWMKDGNNISGAANYFKYVAKTSGKYSVLISTGTCSANSDDVNVLVNALPDTTISIKYGKVNFCAGDSVVFSVPNVAGNTYIWKNNGTPINGATKSTLRVTSNGVYSVTVKNAAGCSNSSSSYAASSNPLPSATITPSGNTTFCAGTPFYLAADSGSGLSYQWKFNGSDIGPAKSQKYSPSQTGLFSVLVTNATGCTKLSSSVLVTINALPPVPTITKTINKLSSSATSGNQWYKDGTIISGATNQSYDATSNGKYKVVVTDGNGCSSSSIELDFTFTGIGESTTNYDINVYPNPNSGNFNLMLNGFNIKNGTLVISDVLGKVYLVENISSEGNKYSKNISLKNLTSGIYLIEIMDQNGSRYLKKFTIE